MPRFTCVECGRRYYAPRKKCRCEFCEEDKYKFKDRLPHYKDPKIMAYIRRYRNYKLEDELAEWRKVDQERHEKGLPYLSYGKWKAQKEFEKQTKR